MARTATTKTSAAKVASDEIKEATAFAVEATNKEENVKDVVKKLTDKDEIEVESLVANVSYKDSKTGDYFEWPTVGHVEVMTMDVIRNMWRNHKGYFRDMILKPLDDRVVDDLGLKRTYAKYESFADASFYSRDNIDEALRELDSAPDTVKAGIVRRFYVLVENGEINDIQVLRKIEKHYDIDLISLL